MPLLLSVAVGSALGGVVRYLLSGAIQVRVASGFPVGTLVVNLVGSFILGGVVRYAAIHPEFSPQVRLLLGAGFCGGFTTFSTFSVETVELLHRGETTKALLYTGGSVLVALAAALVGMAAIRAFTER